MFGIAIIFLIVSGFGLATVFTVVIIRRADIGFYSLLAVNLYDFTFGMNAGMIGRVHLNALDIVSICLLVAGVIKTVRNLRVINQVRILTLCFQILFLFSLVRGFATNGILTTSNESRGFIGPLIATLYFIDVDVSEAALRKYAKAYIAFGLLLCVVASLAATGLPIGETAWAHLDSAPSDGRYLPASAAGAICVCAFLSLAVYQYRKRGFVAQVLPIIFVAFAVFLRHRTVWMMLLAGTVALLFLDGKMFRRLLPVALVAALAVGAFVIYSTVHRGAVGEDQFVDSASNQQTWVWRVNSWVETLNDEGQGPIEMMIGKPLGSGYWRIDPETHYPTTAPPHSEYVQDYSRVGILGALCILGFLALPIKRIWHLKNTIRNSVFPSESIWVLLLIVEMVYGITYSIEPHSYALIGIANAIAIRYRSPEFQTSRGEADDWDTDRIAGLAS